MDNKSFPLETQARTAHASQTRCAGCGTTCCRRSATISARTPTNASISRAANSSTPTGPAKAAPPPPAPTRCKPVAAVGDRRTNRRSWSDAVKPSGAGIAPALPTCQTRGGADLAIAPPPLIPGCLVAVSGACCRNRGPRAVPARSSSAPGKSAGIFDDLGEANALRPGTGRAPAHPIDLGNRPPSCAPARCPSRILFAPHCPGRYNTRERPCISYKTISVVTRLSE